MTHDNTLHPALKRWHDALTYLSSAAMLPPAEQDDTERAAILFLDKLQQSIRHKSRKDCHE